MSNITLQEALLMAADAANLGHSCINDLGSLFQAIIKIADASPSTSNHLTVEMAKIGQYLADDWAYKINREREEIEALRGPH
ncbi:hypothetical protein HNQ57_002833 [Zhongshania antarctica]|uniref:Uncharacterized protein n=1 Tax=Zhongshania antarctica TaxID=641702 RepID=A0A840R7V4_9GAMM|nr:hypothetical protein [Zhongshania antarctica]MBB5188543.1 hypothetical protein [Zhongshania antarctica]